MPPTLTTLPVPPEPSLPPQAVVALTAHECLLSIVHALFVGTPSEGGGAHSPSHPAREGDAPPHPGTAGVVRAVGCRCKVRGEWLVDPALTHTPSRL